MPLPVPLSPDAIRIQSTAADAVHAHPDSVETATLIAPPPASIVCAAGAIWNAQGAASWRTTAVAPLTTTSPCRIEVPGLASTRNSTRPFPWPETGDRLEIQLTLVDAVQVHSASVVTATLPVAPVASIAFAGVDTAT